MAGDDFRTCCVCTEDFQRVHCTINCDGWREQKRALQSRLRTSSQPVSQHGEKLPRLPRGWLLASISVRRDAAWCYSGSGPLTYDVVIERGDSKQVVGIGRTAVEALRAAVEAIGA